MILLCRIALIHTHRAMPLPCPVLRESPRVVGKIRTANRETPRGNRKEQNLGRSPTGRRKTADVISHIRCRADTMLCRGLEKSLAKRHSRSTAGARYGMCELVLNVRQVQHILDTENLKAVTSFGFLIKPSSGCTSLYKTACAGNIDEGWYLKIITVVIVNIITALS